MDKDINENLSPRRLEFIEDNSSMSIEQMEEQRIEEHNVEFMEEQNLNQDKCLNLIDPSDDAIDLVHSNVLQENVPKVGMEFDNEQEVYDFYNKYAKDVEFSIRIFKGHKDKYGNWMDRIFCCSCQGTRRSDKRDDDVKRHRPETRFGCIAMLKVSQFNGKLRVTKFIAEHTHALASPRKRMFLRSQRTINPIQAVELDIADQFGIAPKESVGFLSRNVGGLENLGFIPNDYSNYLRSKRIEKMKVEDTSGVLEYLQNMQHDDPNFSYAIQVDLDDLVSNIFWTYGRIKLDYQAFGDVVSFDTTYRKNKEGRPFVMFVGVNHHKQSVIFGAALLYDETCDTFVWLFDSFVKAMCGKKPKTILTDQDAAMAKALASQ